MRALPIVMCAVLFLTGCDLAQPVPTSPRDATLNLIWENHSDRRYFVVIAANELATPRGGALIDTVAVIEPCQRAGVWGVRLPWLWSVRFPLADDGDEASKVGGSGLDWSMLRHSKPHLVRIEQDDPPEDGVSLPEPLPGLVPPFEPEPLC